MVPAYWRLDFLLSETVYRHSLDPIALSLGPVTIHWYGIMYLVAFGLFYWLGRIRLQQPQYAKVTELDVRALEDILFYGMLGVILGGRIGHILFIRLPITSKILFGSLWSGKGVCLFTEDCSAL